MKYAIVLMVALLLLFGCGGGNNGASGTSGGTGANTGASAGNGGSSGGNNNDSSGGSGASSGANGSGASGGTGGASGAGGSGGSVFDVASSTLSQIIDASIPAVCDIEPTGADADSASVKVYIKGENVRYEISQEVNGKLENSLMIMRDNVLYFQVTEEQKADLGGCDWLIFPVNESQSVQGGNMNPADLRTMPATDYTCTPAAFGNEKFETPGKACDFMQILAEQMQGAT
ncbi:MAG: hypothetical protein NT157_04145 [Candidatus Micrarchaeota archaeon]|nr:hypothetical protein [Candidatus Micrarchaeota archaeon]